MTISTRQCSWCEITIPAPENLEQITPDGWVQNPRPPYGLVCHACHIRASRAGWRPPARYEINHARMREALEQIKNGTVT